MNLKATLSDITITFTPDQWGQAKKILEYSVAQVEEINAKGYEEDPKTLPQLFAPTKQEIEAYIPCACGLTYKCRQWIKKGCNAKHPDYFTVVGESTNQ